ncbi:MAG: oxidoreductase [bacterium]|nr:oxidoreductase [bacterium]
MKPKNTTGSRREFIKKSIAGIAGAAILPPSLKAAGKKIPESTQKKPAFIYRKLGNTPVNLPIVSMGAANTGNANLVQAALDSGICYFDTGHYYGKGRNEAMLGNAVKGRPRDSFLISTKVLAEYEDHVKGTYTGKAKPGNFIEKFEISLKRLQMDYVDIFLLHGAGSREAALYEPLLTAMTRLKKQGKARFIGVSTHINEPEVIRAAVESHVYDIVMTAYNFRQPHKEEVKKAIGEAAKMGLGVIAMKTQAGVYWDKERRHPINPKAALKWVLQDENVHTAIPGMTSFDQLQSNISIMEDLNLTAREISALKLDHKTAMSGLYCAQCSRCRSQCRYNLAIPTVMRSYMYAYGYQSPLKARTVLEAEARSDIACRECGDCAVSCTMGFDIPGKIKEIIPLLDVPGDFLVLG